MSRKPNEDYTWMIGLVVAVIAFALAACFWVLSGCGHVVYRGYRRHGRRLPLVVLAVLVGSTEVAAALIALAGGYLTAAVTAGVSLAAWTAGTALVTALYDHQERTALQSRADQSLADVLAGDDWWR
jgi:hypothetical protein